MRQRINWGAMTEDEAIEVIAEGVLELSGNGLEKLAITLITQDYGGSQQFTAELQSHLEEEE